MKTFAIGTGAFAAIACALGLAATPATARGDRVVALTSPTPSPAAHGRLTPRSAMLPATLPTPIPWGFTSPLTRPTLPSTLPTPIPWAPLPAMAPAAIKPLVTATSMPSAPPTIAPVPTGAPSPVPTPTPSPTPKPQPATSSTPRSTPLPQQN